MIGGGPCVGEAIARHELRSRQQLGRSVRRSVGPDDERERQRSPVARDNGSRDRQAADREQRNRYHRHAAAVDRDRQNRRGRESRAQPPRLKREVQEVQQPRQIERRQKGTIASGEVERQRSREREDGRGVDDQRQECQPHGARQQPVHAEQADPVVQDDVHFHREGERHDGDEEVDRTEQRDRRVLPHHVAAALPRAPERRLAVRHDVLEDFAEVEQLPIPVGGTQPERSGKQWQAEQDAQEAVQRADTQRASRELLH